MKHHTDQELLYSHPDFAIHIDVPYQISQTFKMNKYCFRSEKISQLVCINRKGKESINMNRQIKHKHRWRNYLKQNKIIK